MADYVDNIEDVKILR